MQNPTAVAENKIPAVPDIPWSLIGPEEHWLLLIVIAAGVAVSIYLEQNFRWAARVSGPLLALMIAMLLANIGVMPQQALVYTIVKTCVVPLAIPLLLFKANVFAIVRSSKSLFIAFHIATVGTLLGAFAAPFILKLLGWEFPHLAEACGIMAASYIGGGVNFMAVQTTFNTPADVANPLLIADSFVMAGAFALLLAVSISRFFLSRYPHPHTAAVSPEAAAQLAAEHWQRKPIGLLDMAKALAIAFAVTGLAIVIGDYLSPGDASGALKLLFNPYVMITATMLVLATVFPKAIGGIHGAEEMGMYLLYTFLFVIGLPADLFYVLQQTPVMFVLCFIIAAFNIVFTFGVGKLLRMNLEELIIAVNITLGGPPTGAAFTIAKGWSQLVLPALLIGIWGYIIGTALGIMVTYGLWWLGIG